MWKHLCICVIWLNNALKENKQKSNLAPSKVTQDTDDVCYMVVKYIVHNELMFLG